MPRPTKFRNVEFFPENNFFVPAGKPRCEVKELSLKVEELEAMRLKDIEKLNQEACAVKMNVSRQTFQNILSEARRKTTLALIEGYGIKICGGNYTSAHCQYICDDCGNVYNPQQAIEREKCPKCNGTNVHCKKKSKHCKKWCKN